MRKVLFGLVLVTFVISCKSSLNRKLPFTNGVSKELAAYRKLQLSDLKYNLHFSIPYKLEDPIIANLRLELKVHDITQPLILDFKSNRELPETALVNGKKIGLKYEKEHLVIPVKDLVPDKNTVEIEFLAGEMSLNRMSDHLFTLLVPDRARTLFPCFDQPDLKATYVLNLTTPKDWSAISSSALDFEIEKGDYTERQFKESDKISTYLFSFVAGEFQLARSGGTSNNMQMLHRESDQKKIDASLDRLFILHEQAIKYLEEYTNYEYPFQKLDFATIFTHPYGGMEHVGAIQYRQTSLFMDANATQSQKLRRAKLISHETSHMWFGDLVTMRWFDDVWLKEVFAGFMADKIINPTFPEINHDLQFFAGHYPASYSIDRGNGANPIRQDLDNLNNAGSLYGAIIYNKAPIMFRQLELLLGEDKFRQGVAKYTHKYAYDNADWNDLINIFDNKTNLDLKQWSHVWVNSPGRPVISAEISYDDKDHIHSFEITQEAEDGSGKIWPQIFDIALLYPDTTEIISIDLREKRINIQDAEGLAKPDLIIYNSNAYGYGVFPFDFELLDSVYNIQDEIKRASAYLNIYENTLNGKLTFTEAFSFFQKGLSQEPNDLILSMISANITSIYWTYFTDKQRSEYQPEIEALIFKRLQQEESSNIKKTLFKSFKSMAYTGEALDRLYHIWNKDISIPGLFLNMDDYTDIAMSLALYQHNKSEEILSDTRKSLKDASKIERFDFLMPSLSCDAETRIRFFKSLADEKNREKESWVLSACSNIHHPLHQKTAIGTLKQSLELLEEIQQTGDIFFPKGWLDNTIGKYSSKEAMDILEDFIETHPDLNPQLMLKLLQSTDSMYRIQKISETAR